MTPRFGFRWRSLLPLVLLLLCGTSLALYLAHNELLGRQAETWTYHRQLWSHVFPAGERGAAFAEVLRDIPRAHDSTAGLRLLVFTAACLTTGWLARLRLGRDLPRGPTVLMFAYAAAVLPPQILALLRFPDGGGWIRSPLLLGIALALAAVLGLSLLLRRPPPRPAKAPGGGFGSLIFMPILLALLLAAFWDGSTRVAGYDALAYHLPLAAMWQQSGSLEVGTLVQSFLPANQSLLLFWCLETGGDRFTFIVPWAATLVALFALYDLARALGQRRGAAMAAVAGAASLPWLLNLATVSYADTGAAALLLFSLRFILHWRAGECRRLAPLVCAGLALGLGLGTKFSLLPAGVVIILAAVFVFWGSEGIRRPPDRRLPGVPVGDELDRRCILLSLLVFAGTVLAGCGYWLLRNTAYTGNPLFPVSFFGLAGYRTGDIVSIGDSLNALGWRRLLLPWTERTFASFLDDGLGPLFTGFALPYLTFRLALNRSSRERSQDANLLYAVMLGVLGLFLLTNTHMARYAIVWIFLAFLFLGELWQRWASPGLRTLFIAAWLLTAVLQLNLSTGGALYKSAMMPQGGARRFYLPAAVDSLPPSRILSAAGSDHRYGLMGEDHRHRVFALFRAARPQDLEAFDVDCVLLEEAQEAQFLAREPMELLGRSPYLKLSLWRRECAKDRGAGYPLADRREVLRFMPEVLSWGPTTP